MLLCHAVCDPNPSPNPNPWSDTLTLVCSQNLANPNPCLHHLRMPLQPEKSATKIMGVINEIGFR